MQKITNQNSLKEAIILLEIEQDILSNELNKQIFLTYESLKPVNILKNSLKEIGTSPYLMDNVLGAITGFASGYISKKIIVGASSNIIRKFIGFILQFGVANVVAQHPEAIKNVGKTLFQSLFAKKEKNT